jgi:hypothetical protein
MHASGDSLIIEPDCIATGLHKGSCHVPCTLGFGVAAAVDSLGQQRFSCSDCTCASLPAAALHIMLLQGTEAASGSTSPPAVQAAAAGAGCRRAVTCTCQNTTVKSDTTGVAATCQVACTVYKQLQQDETFVLCSGAWMCIALSGAVQAAAPGDSSCTELTGAQQWLIPCSA